MFEAIVMACLIARPEVCETQTENLETKQECEAWVADVKITAAGLLAERFRSEAELKTAECKKSS